MTDVAIGEAPTEPVPPNLAAIAARSAPEATAELDAAPPQAAAVDGLAPAPDEPAAASSSAEAPAGDTGEVEMSFDPRTSIPESLGPVRRAILEGLIDTEGPMSVSQLHALMPVGTPRGTAEAGILREYRSGRIERVAPGVYGLAPPKPPEPRKSTPADPPAVHSDGATDEQFFALLDIWTASGKWEGPGNPPGQAGCLVPLGIISKHNDRVRKRLERHRDREAAQARQSAADTALRDQLITATGGNIVRGPGIDDVSPIRAAMELVPIDRILSAIRSKVDKKMFPGNAPATSWREPRLLCEIADSYFRSIIQPRLVAAWSGAGKTAAPTVPILSPAGDMPDDIHELRSCHDQEHAPPGPHAMPQPDAAPDVPQEPVERAEPPAAVLAPLEPESASTAPQTNGSRPSDDSVAEPAPSDRSGNAQSTETTTTSPHPDTGGVNRTPSLDLPDGQVPETGAPPVAEGRAAVLAAFARSRALASSQSAPPQPRPAVRQVERPPERQAEPISREGWEELVSGYVAGNVNWNPRRLGAPPGSPDCRAPRDVLRSFGL